MEYRQQCAVHTANFQGLVPAEIEIINEKERYNDYILTTLRTIWGVNTSFIKHHFSSNFERFFY